MTSFWTGFELLVACRTAVDLDLVKVDSCTTSGPHYSSKTTSIALVTVPDAMDFVMLWRRYFVFWFVLFVARTVGLDVFGAPNIIPFADLPN